MSRLLEFLLGSLLIPVFTVAFLFFFMLHYILGVRGMTDCAWHAFARTWIDSNGDGVVKDGEPPLRNMEIHVDAVRNRLIAISWPAITNKDGEVQFNVPIPGCSATVFEMYVDVPEGYRITTSPRIAVHPDVWESLGTARVYYFGFVFDQ